MHEPIGHGVIVLAAGASTRLGRSKQDLPHHGEPLVRRAVRLALSTSPRDALIVVGANANTVHAHVADLPIRRVDCVDWQAGMGASLRAGIAALSDDCAGALVMVCDQPGLAAEHLHALCAAWHDDPQRGAASFYADRLGVPALLPRNWFNELDASSDRGARDILARRRKQITHIANELLALDIDRPEDLVHLT
jgi:CTP:molybdopterin cytidylyltransferase MocA